MGGISRSKTIKMHGRIVDTQIILMIDSGASHCFVSETLVHKLSLLVQSTSFVVKLGDGQCLTSLGYCPALPIKLGSLSITPNCYVFPSSGVDVILKIY